MTSNEFSARLAAVNVDHSAHVCRADAHGQIRIALLVVATFAEDKITVWEEASRAGLACRIVDARTVEVIGCTTEATV